MAKYIQLPNSPNFNLSILRSFANDRKAEVSIMKKWEQGTYQEYLKISGSRKNIKTVLKKLEEL
mgnify:FL=1|jgi:hypothetical protein|tara:strand:+ start:98 stop:289 length:192 start_codon:yes stop_codon:yes gene_type:complete